MYVMASILSERISTILTHSVRLGGGNLAYTSPFRFSAVLSKSLMLFKSQKTLVTESVYIVPQNAGLADYDKTTFEFCVRDGAKIIIIIKL